MPGTYTSRATAKFWIMPRTGTALVPVDSTATGVTATKGFDLARDLIGGLPELEDQIGGAMTGTSGQARAERVATAVRDLQSLSMSRTQRQPRPSCLLARQGRGRDGILAQYHRRPPRQRRPVARRDLNTRPAIRFPLTCSSAIGRRCQPWVLRATTRSPG